MLFGDKILVYRDEILKDLATLLEIESVDGERNEECERALAFIIKRAQDFGLDYKMATEVSSAACWRMWMWCRQATTGASFRMR